MHPIQKKLLELSQKYDLSALGLRQVGRLIGEPHPQKIKHHLQQLGILDAPADTKTGASQSKLLTIPLMGYANCGHATIYADQIGDQFLQVSQRILPYVSDDFFAVQAVGNSMDKANIQGVNIQSGDYVIVNPVEKNFTDGDYVVSIINGMANIKKFTKNHFDNQIVLLSESKENHPPIFIHEDDMSYFMTSGKVIKVLKQPNNDSNEFSYHKSNYI